MGLTIQKNGILELQMMGTLMLDNKMARLAMSMKVHYSIPGDKKPGDISGTANLPSPTIMTLTNYTHKNEEELDIDYNFIEVLENNWKNNK